MVEHLHLRRRSQTRYLRCLNMLEHLEVFGLIETEGPIVVDLFGLLR